MDKPIRVALTRGELVEIEDALSQYVPDPDDTSSVRHYKAAIRKIEAALRSDGA